MSIHKAAFFWNDQTKKQQITVCGNYNSYKETKVIDWDTVTCKRCLLNKDSVQSSTVNLL